MSALHSLPVRDAKTYAGNFPKFSQPKEVACFSRDEKRHVTFDRSALRNYRPPALPAALNEGFETYVPRENAEGEPATLEDVISALAHKKVDLSTVNVVTYRNNLNKIFLTPYAPREDWEVGVEWRGDGSVFLHVRETARKAAEEAARDERAQRMSYWGCGPAGTGGLPPVNANEEFCSVVQLSIEKVKLLMAAEIDCATAAGSADSGGYVELKTSKQPGNARALETFERHKLLKFWLQSFLAGVPSVVVGFRDDEGMVRELKTFETKTIHRLVRANGYWDPTVPFNFGKAVLDWMLQHVSAAVGAAPAKKRFVMRYEPAAAAVVLRHDEGEVATADAGAPVAKRQRTVE